MSKDTYTVERTAIIDAPPEVIYAQIIDFNNFQAWSPWEDLDPDMEKAITGAESGVGSIYTWSGNRKAGAGSMEIVEVSPNSRMVADLKFTKPMKSESQMSMTLEPVVGAESPQTKVTWDLVGKRTLMTKIMEPFIKMDKIVGSDYQKGLARLKVLAETQASAATA